MHTTLLAATRRSDELRRFHWGIFAENNCLYDRILSSRHWDMNSN